MLGIVSVIAFVIVEIALLIKKKNVRILYYAVAAEAVFLMAYSALTYGQATITSDVVTPVLLWDSMVKHHSLIPKTFNYANGDIWILSLQMTYGIPSLFITSQPLARMMSSVIFELFAIAGIVYMSKKAFRDNSWTLIVPIIFLIVVGERRMLIWEAGYIALVLWLTLVPSLYAKITKERKKLAVIVGILLIVLGTASPMRYAAELIVPLILATIITEYMSGKKLTKDVIKEYSIKIGLVLIVPAIISKLLYRWICSGRNVNPSLVTSTSFVSMPEDIWNNMQMVIINMLRCFGYYGDVSLGSLAGMINLISITMLVLLCFVVPYLQAKKLKDENDNVKFYYIFAMSHNAVLIMTCVFFGQVETARYLLTTVILFIVISSRYIYNYWLNNDTVGILLTIAFVFCVVIEGSNMSRDTIGWQDELAHKTELANFLKENNLTKGYATYWNAYETQIYSNSEVELGGIEIDKDGLTPFYWLVDDSVYEPVDSNTFLLLTAEEHDALKFNLVSKFGAPIQELRCGDSYIIVFNYDIVLNMKKSNIK